MRTLSRLGGLPGGWPAVDAVVWVVAVGLAALVDRSIAPPPGHAWWQVLLVGLGAAAVQVALGRLLHSYRIGYVAGSFEQLLGTGRLTALVGLVVLALTLVVPQWLRWQAGLVAALLAVLLTGACRALARDTRARAAGRRSAASRVIVFGAGVAGTRLVRNMLLDEESTYLPVAVVDDDPAKARLRVDRVPVVGDRTRIAAAARELDATHLVIAVPSADSALIQQVRRLATGAGLQVKVLPTIENLLSQRVGIEEIKDVDVEDLLGRRPVELDIEAIGSRLRDEVVLITGAGGSIGSELARQIARFGPRRLVTLDRDESGLLTTHLSITGDGVVDVDDCVLADLRDRAAIAAVFERVRPTVVFHAAALKHLRMLQTYPLEAWKTNVLGTAHVLAAAAAVGVTTFVNISTDKAAEPTSVLGFSKRITERLTAAYARREPGTYVSVRFGNVLGSRGSVIPTFTEQIRRGGPVTVTHPDVERFFMLIPEACRLVLQATVLGRDGQILVLDMGRPVRVDEVARTLIELSGRQDTEIVYTGLGPAEKLTERVLHRDEQVIPTGHRLISAVDVDPIEPELLGELPADVAADPEAVTRWLRETSHRPGPGGGTDEPPPEG